MADKMTPIETMEFYETDSTEDGKRPNVHMIAEDFDFALAGFRAAKRNAFKAGLLAAASFCEHFEEDGRDSNEPKDCARELWLFAGDEAIIDSLIAEQEKEDG